MGVFGKLEGRITVPTGGWTGTIEETTGGGAQTFTVAAGDYYHSSGDTGTDLETTFEVALETASSNGYSYTVTPAMGESGTGKTLVGRASGSGNIAIVWTSTDLRDVLGFSQGDVSGAGSYTSADSGRSVWLPDGPGRALNGSSSAGRMVGAYQAQESAAGHYNALMGPRKRVNAVDWTGVSRSRMWKANEAVVNQSLEQFIIDVIYGEANWSTRPGGPFRWYPDADTDASYFTYSGGFSGPEFEQLQAQYTGQWNFRFPRMVEVPA